MHVDRDALEIVLHLGGEMFNKRIFGTDSFFDHVYIPEKFTFPDSPALSAVELHELSDLLHAAAKESLSQHYNKKIGFTLSGGVDSSLMLYLMKKIYPDSDIVAYHTDWNYPPRSELEFARIAAKHAGVELKVVDVHPDTQAEYLEDAIIKHRLVDYGATSAYLAFQKMVEDSVDIAVNSLGLDELFASYTIHRRYYNRSRIRFLPYSNFLMSSKYYRGLSRKWGTHTAWFISGADPRPSTRFVKNSSISVVQIFNERMKGDTLWDSIHNWTLDAMLNTYGNAISLMAKAVGLDVIYPYMNRDLMKRTLSYSETAKRNKAPIRKLMRESYNFPESIASRGEKWDKLGWGGTGEPYFESKKYLDAIMPSGSAENDWFTEKAVDEYHRLQDRPTIRSLHMAIFLKILENA